MKPEHELAACKQALDQYRAAWRERAVTLKRRPATEPIPRSGFVVELMEEVAQKHGLATDGVLLGLLQSTNSEHEPRAAASRAPCSCSAIRYDIAWKDHKLERGPVTPQDAANIVVHHLREWPDDPIWLTPNKE